MSRPVHCAADRDHLGAHPRFPRASDYHPDWVFGNNMGPNALWLMEWLTEAVPLQPESRVLDMGCGRGITSVFLAEQFGVKVVANDLWIKPGDNWERFVEAGCADSIIPIHAEGARTALRRRLLRLPAERRRLSLLRDRGPVSRLLRSLRTCRCSARRIRLMPTRMAGHPNP